MKSNANYKSVGGVESCTLYPADAVTTALFSCEGCEIELSGTAIEVPLLDDASEYEECSQMEVGATLISHRLHLVAERNEAKSWLNDHFIERAYTEGLVAVISLYDGRRLLAGYSAQFGDEQPLRLESLTSTSGTSLNETPSVTLRLISQDTEFSPEIL